jgi:hypothetical protein
MIVNPQVFNYRLTIGTLLAAIAFLVVYGFSNYDAVVTDNDFIKHEKRLLQSELGEIIKKYSELGSEKNSLKSQLVDEKTRIEIAQDSLSLLKADVELIPRFRDEIKFLTQQNKQLHPDSFREVINTLSSDKSEKEALLKLQKNVIVTLEKQKQVLEETLEKGKLIYANSFEANAFRIKNSGEKLETTRAKNTAYVEVCFVIGENPLAENGEKELYIQILDPNNNVVADKGAVNFGESSLIYSSKIYVDYNNELEEICASIPNEENFERGTYYISVFEKERKLGHTQINLF